MNSFSAFYISMPLTAIGGIALIGSRSYLTKIVGRDEIGRLMSFMSAMDTLVPMVSSSIFTFIFNYTIDKYPGTVYQLTAFLILIPILSMMWIDLYTERPVFENGSFERKGSSHSQVVTDQNENDRHKAHNEPENVSKHYHKHKRQQMDYKQNDISIISECYLKNNIINITINKVESSL